ncbi:MAG: hypothetical protein IJV83_02230 [Clostridia bacterium]|nr:hypothetical protein [Clostridia bacterium]
MIKRSKLVYVLGSVVIGIISVMFIIAGLIFSGVLDSSSKKLVFTSTSMEKVYNGNELTAKGLTEAEQYEMLGNLKSGHTAVVDMLGTQTAAGSSENIFEVTVYDTNGADVTGDYDIVKYYGTLDVTPRPLTVEANSWETVFDGNEFVCNEQENKCIFNEEELVPGHRLECVVSGSTTTPTLSGNIKTYFESITIYDALDNDVTANYDLTKYDGTLTMAKRELSLTSKSNTETWIYNGEAYTLEEVKEDVAMLLPMGHEYELTWNDGQTNAGERENSFDIKITYNGQDVTEHYALDLIPGILKVDKRPMTIVSKGNEWEFENGSARTYNGETYTLAQYDISAAEGMFDLVDGHTLNLDNWAYIEFSGEKENSFEVKSIIDEEENDITENYDITKVFGKIQVNQREFNIVTPTAGATFNGAPQCLDSNSWAFKDGVDNTSQDFEKVLEEENFKGYTMQIEYPAIRDVGSVYNTIESYKIYNGEKDVTKGFNVILSKEMDNDGKYKDVGMFTVTPYVVRINLIAPGTKNATPAEQYAELTKIYDGTELAASNDEVVFLDNSPFDGLFKEGYSYSINPNVKLTDVGNEKNSAELVVTYTANIDGEIVKKNDSKNFELKVENARNLKVTPRTIILQSENINDLTYNGTEQTIAYAFSIGLNGENKKYIGDYGYTANANGITTAEEAYEQMQWSLKTLGNDEGAENVKRLGHTLQIVVGGKMTNVSDYNKFTSLGFTIKDAQNKDFTHNYVLSDTAFGYLKMNPYTVHVDTILKKSENPTYTGMSLTNEYVEYKMVGGAETTVMDWLGYGETEKLYENFRIELAECINAGDYEVGISSANPTVIAANGSDYSKNFIVKQAGKASLTIEKATLTFMLQGAEKLYDGKELSNPINDAEWQDVDGLCRDAGDTIKELEFTTLAKTDVNNSIRNEVTKIIVVRNGKDVTNNYIIENEYDAGTDDYIGYLTIKPIDLTLRTISDALTYDGEWHDYDEYNTAPIAENVLNEINACLVNGDTFDYEYDERTHSKTLTVKDVVRDENGNVIGIKNAPRVIITDQYGNNVTAGYNIIEDFGVITVNPKVIAVESVSETVSYKNLVEDTVAYPNGKLTKHQFVSDPNAQLLDGHTVTWDWTGEISEVAWVEGKVGDTYTFVSNTFKLLQIMDGATEDVTHNYQIDPIYGKLTVTPIEITIKTASLEKVYDGKPIDAGDETEILQEERLIGSLANGHEYHIEFDEKTKLAVAGSVDNAILNVKIKDAAENDVTRNYIINKVHGQITIWERPITIRSDSANKLYDGTPLKADALDEDNVVSFYKLSEGEKLVDGVSVRYADVIRDYRISASQTEIGESNNYIDYVRIQQVELNSDGDIVRVLIEDVTNSYDIEYQYGKLVVKNNQPVNTTAVVTPDSLQGSGTALPNTVVGRVKSTLGGDVYLRVNSRGDYEVASGEAASWSAVSADEQYQENANLIDEKYGMNYLSGLALEQWGVGEKGEVNVYVNNKDYGYLMPYYMAAEELNYDVQTGDVYQIGDVVNEYAMSYYAYDFTDGFPESAAILGDYRLVESKYRTYVKDTYCTVGNIASADYLRGIAQQKGWQIGYKDRSLSKGEYDIVYKVARYIKNAARYNENYDESNDIGDGVYQFLTSSKEGVCRHFASAATLLYRILGIPARYTTGYRVATDANAYTEIKAADAHAWVEVYVNGIGWIPVDVTPSSSSSEVDLDNYELLVYPKEASYQTENGYSYGDEYGFFPIVDGYLNQDALDGNDLFQQMNNVGYTFKATYDINRENIKADGYGYLEVWLTELRIYNTSGIDVTENYDVYYQQKSKLIVYKYELNISSIDINDFRYTGEEWIVPDEASMISYNPTDIASDHKITIDMTGKVQNWSAEGTENTFTVSIEDKLNGDDYTHQYKINYTYGKLNVKRAELELTSADKDEKYVSGAEPSGQSSVYITNGELLEGHSIYTQTEWVYHNGFMVSKISYVAIYDEKGMNVTDNYLITYKDGIQN